MTEITPEALYPLLAAAISDVQGNMALWGFYRAAGKPGSAQECLQATEHKLKVTEELMRQLSRALMEER